ASSNPDPIWSLKSDMSFASPRKGSYSGKGATIIPGIGAAAVWASLRRGSAPVQVGRTTPVQVCRTAPVREYRPAPSCTVHPQQLRWILSGRVPAGGATPTVGKPRPDTHFGFCSGYQMP